MGEDIPRGSTLIGALVGMACQAIGRKPLWDTVDHLNAAQTHAALARLTSILERRVPFADTVEEEKRTGQALLLEIFRDDKQRKSLLAPANTGADPGTASAQSLSMLLYLVYSKSRIMQNYTTYADKSAQLARQPYGLHLPPPSLPTDPLNRALAPVFTEARLKDVEIETQNSLLLLTLALHAYRLEHGRYPVSLAALSPAYLKVLPDDPFGVKGTFKYKISGKSYLLYSIGPDGKDDGGTPIDDVGQAGSANPNARYFVNQNSVGDVVAGTNRY